MLIVQCCIELQDIYCLWKVEEKLTALNACDH